MGQHIGAGQRSTFPPTQARYLIIRILSNQGGTNAELGEVAAFGPAGASSGSTSSPTTPGTSKLKVTFISNTAAAGGRQVAQVVAGKNAPVTIVVYYPNGTQTTKQEQAGANGQLLYTWTIPKSAPGTVYVTVVSAGKVARGSFTVS
ncbi:MAG: hypothetical protein ACRDG4_04315 [Chloroflexota bacterium]